MYQKNDMDFWEFKQKLIEEIKKVLPPALRNASVSELPVEKGNNVTKTGIVTRLPDLLEGCCLYAEDLYKEACGMPGSWDNKIFYLAKEYVSTVEKSTLQLKENEIDAGSIMDYKNAKENLQIIPVDPKLDLNAVCNYISHIEGDLAAIYRVCVPLPDGRTGSVKVTPELMQMWNVTPDEIHRQALSNMKMSEYEIRYLNYETCVFDRISLLEAAPHIFDMPGVAVTNRDNTFGANFIFKPDIMERISELAGGDFYVVPMSKHELMILSEDVIKAPGMNGVFEIAKCIKDVNDGDFMDQEDVLSYDLQFYDAKEKKLVNAVQRELMRGMPAAPVIEPYSLGRNTGR